MIHYSIIIPHYNIPHLLVRCLRSIPQRDDVQVIVVDDGSLNADKYLEMYSELTAPGVEFYPVAHRGSAGAMRNIGLGYAKGKWILFADADDYFNKCIADILDDYLNSQADVVYFKASSVDNDTKMPTWRNRQLNSFIDSYKDNPDEARFNLRYLFGEPWCKMVKHSIIQENNVQFEETVIHDDTAYSYLVGYFAKNIGVDERMLYCITTREQSVSRQISTECYLTRVRVFAEKYRFLKSKGLNVLETKFIFPTIKVFLRERDFPNACRCYAYLDKAGVPIYISIYYTMKLFLKTLRNKGHNGW